MQALVGQDAPFDHGRQQMKILAGLEVTTKAVERTAEAIGGDIAQREEQEIQRAVQLDLPIVVGEPIPILYVQMDGTGVPVVKKETEGRKGKLDGLPAHTREAKLGCVFTQTSWDEEGFAVRDQGSTTYTGAIENAEEFGKRLYVEAWKRGWSRAGKKVVIGDGAEWIWNIANDHFPGAVQIVDLYHARQHLWELARRSFPTTPDAAINGSGASETLARQRQDRKTGSQPPLHTNRRYRIAKKIRNEADYFANNAARMHYPNSAGNICSSAPASSKPAVKRSSAPAQTVRNVLDRPRRQRHPGPALLSPQRPL